MLPAPVTTDGFPVDVLAVWREVRARTCGPRFVVVGGASGSGRTHALRALLGSGGPGRAVLLDAPDVLPGLVGALHGCLAGQRDATRLAWLRAVRPDLAWPVVAAAAEGDEGSVGEPVVEAWTRAAFEEGGALLAVDDVDAATPDDVRVLRALWRAAAAQGAPVMIVVAGGETGPAWLGDVRVTAALGGEVDARVLDAPLRPLDVAGVRALAEARLGPVDDALPAWLHAHTQGHPMWTAHLLGHVLAGGAVRRVSGAWVFTPPPVDALPAGLDALLRVRWHDARSDARVAELLDVLVVADVAVPLVTLAGASGLAGDALRDAVARAVEAGVVTTALRDGEGVVRAAPPALSRLGRATLARGRELDVHARLARHGGDVHIRARHARLAGRADAVEVTRAALAAAQAAGSSALIAEHADALGRADVPPEERRLARRALGTAQFQLGHVQDAVQTLRDAGVPDAATADVLARALLAAGDAPGGLALLDDVPWRPLPPALRVTRARLQLHVGPPDEALAELEAMDGDPDVPRGPLCSARALSAVLAHDGPRLAREAAAALAHAVTPGERADALNHVALAASWQGDFAVAADAYARCLDLLRDAGREGAMQAVYGNLVNLHAYAASYRDAQRAGATALALARAGGTPLVEANAAGGLGMVQVMLGDEDGLANVRRWAAHHREHVPSMSAYATLHAASAHALFGYGAEARALLALVPDVAGAVRALGYGPVTLAQTWLALGEPGHAAAVLGDAPTYAGDAVGELHLNLTRALLAARTGDVAGAEALLRARLHDPAHARFPSILAEYRWLLLAVRRRLGAPDAELRELGAGVLAFLQTSGGRGHLLLTDRVFPEDHEDRHAALRADVPALTQAFVLTLGRFDLEENGERRPWRARRVRELLALLLCAAVGADRPARTRAELTAALWPDLPEGAATTTFRKTLLRLRAALGGAARVEHGPDGYVLADVHADLTLFLRALAQRDLAAACAWYGGPFLPDVDLPEVTALRGTLHARYRAAALTLAQEADAPHAARLLDALLRDDPLDPDALALLGVLRSVRTDPLVVRLLAHLRAEHERDLGRAAPEVLALLAPA